MPFPVEPPSLPMPGSAKTRRYRPRHPALTAGFLRSEHAHNDGQEEHGAAPSVHKPDNVKSSLRIADDIQKPAKPSDLPASKHSRKGEQKKPETSLPNSTPDSEKLKAPEKKSATSLPPTWNAPVTVAPPSPPTPSDRETPRTQPGEPPLAPAPGPVQLYHVHHRETLQDIARRTLGSSERWGDLHKLNPTLKPDETLSAGTTVRLPADACVQSDDAEAVKPLPALRPKPTAPKAKVLPLTGTYQCSLDEKGQLTLPRALRDQLNRQRYRPAVARPGQVSVADQSAAPGAPGRTARTVAGQRGRRARVQTAVLRADGEVVRQRRRPRQHSGAAGRVRRTATGSGARRHRRSLRGLGRRDAGGRTPSRKAAAAPPRWPSQE